MQVDLRGKLRQCTMRGLSLTRAHRNKVLRHALQLPLEERVGVVGVRGEGTAVYLALAGDEVIQQRDTDGSPDVTRKLLIPDTWLNLFRGTPT